METKNLKRRRWYLNFLIRRGWKKASRITRRAILVRRDREKRERLMRLSDEARAEVYALQESLLETHGIEGYIPPPKFLHGLSVKPGREEKHLRLVWVVE